MAPKPISNTAILCEQIKIYKQVIYKNQSASTVLQYKSPIRNLCNINTNNLYNTIPNLLLELSKDNVQTTFNYTTFSSMP